MNGVINNPGFNFLPMDINATFSYNWTANNNSFETSWTCIAMSSSGQYQTAAYYNGYIYYSNNYGIIWNKANNNDYPYSITWQDVAMSASGQYQTAAASFLGEASVPMYYSLDYGVTWKASNITLISDTDNYNWLSVAVSSSGQYQTAVNSNPIQKEGNNGGYIFRSTDYGVNWETVYSPGVEILFWKSVAMSSSGQYQTVVCNYPKNSVYPLDDGKIFYSTDYGVTWNQSNSPQKVWSCVAMSSSGQYQTATISVDTSVEYPTNDGLIFYSKDYGVTWNQSGTPLLTNWSSVAVSASGQYQTALINGGGIYFSINYGVDYYPSNDHNPNLIKNWSSVAMSSSGQYQSAVYNSQGGVAKGILNSVIPLISLNTSDIYFINQQNIDTWHMSNEETTGALTLYDNSTYGVFLGPGGTSWQSYSDIRIKKNIASISNNELDNILKLRPVNYNFIKDISINEMPIPKRVGFIAQEVEKIYPNLISKSYYSEEFQDYIKGISTTDMIPYLVKAIQEQNEIINRQGEKIEELENKIK